MDLNLRVLESYDIDPVLEAKGGHRHEKYYIEIFKDYSILVMSLCLFEFAARSRLIKVLPSTFSFNLNNKNICLSSPGHCITTLKQSNLSAIIFPTMDLIQEMAKRRIRNGVPDPLLIPISNFLKSINSGTITIHIENQPFLRLTITQSDRDKIKLEFGQKFIEMSLAIGLNRLFDTN